MSRTRRRIAGDAKRTLAAERVLSGRQRPSLKRRWLETASSQSSPSFETDQANAAAEDVGEPIAEVHGAAGNKGLEDLIEGAVGANHDEDDRSKTFSKAEQGERPSKEPSEAGVENEVGDFVLMGDVGSFVCAERGEGNVSHDEAEGPVDSEAGEGDGCRGSGSTHHPPPFRMTCCDRLCGSLV